MFSKILVANRGEVAVRIIRACKEMGIETVAVYSEADRNSLPVALADERICIGGNAAAESYLNQKNIISAALATNAEAIHPGYGFLSENAGFAKLCEENGIVFIGPKSEVISAMGDKDTSRQLMQQVGGPVVPGTEVLKDVEEAKKYVGKFEAAMEDDFNTADAIAAIFELVKYVNTNKTDELSGKAAKALYEILKQLCDILGIIIEKKEELLDADIEALIEERKQARKAKNFARADEIRKELADKGIILEDTRQGVTWKRV